MDKADGPQEAVQWERLMDKAREPMAPGPK